MVAAMKMVLVLAVASLLAACTGNDGLDLIATTAFKVLAY